MKFIYDTKLCLQISNLLDGQPAAWLRHSSWAYRWQIEFNLSKCKVVHYAKENVGYEYSMDNQPVEEMDSEKDYKLYWVLT